MNHRKVIILGSGPAGCTAAIYAARAMLGPLLLHGDQPGGQLTITTDVENYPGFVDPVMGPELMDAMMKQAERNGAEVKAETIVNAALDVRPFVLHGSSGSEYSCDCLIIATGASAKWLGLESEFKYRGFGVSACATCDGFFFKGRTVCVVGGGNTAAEEALYLSHLCSQVYLIHRRDELRAEKILQDRIMKNPKIVMVWNSELKEVVGDEKTKTVNSVLVLNRESRKIEKLDVDGVFIAIGHRPSSDIFKGKLDMDSEGYIITAPGAVTTSVPGVFAVGDVQDKTYRQAVTAAGTGCMAALDSERYLASQNLI